jgi:O-antigen/teichoic acid export membrane protein
MAAELVPDEGSVSTGRTRRIGISAMSAVASKGISVLVSLVTVPLTVGYLGAERYGAWVTIGSLLAWMQLADLGLGNGLTNALAGAYGRQRDDLARANVASGIWMLTGLAAILGLTATVVGPWLNWAGFLGVTDVAVQHEISVALAASMVIFLAGFPLLVVDKVLLAYQEGAIANGWSAAASVATLASVVAVSRAQGGMLALVLATAGTRVVVQALCALWLFFLHRPALRPGLRHFDLATARSLFSAGLAFFLVQVAALVQFNTDNVVIAHLLGPERVTPYSTAWRLFSLPGLAMALVFPYLWSAYAEALARRDFAWVTWAMRWTGGASLILSAVVALPLVVFGEPIIRLWAGSAAVPPWSVLPWMGWWACVSSFMNAVACLLNATGRVKELLWFGMATSALNLGLSIWWAQVFGLAGVIAATVVAYLVGTLVPTLLLARRLYREFSGPAETGL